MWSGYPEMLKNLFPACASFGPLAIVIGNSVPSRPDTVFYSTLVGGTGALMTSAALMMLFRMISSTSKAPNESKQSIESKS